jgi:hypothetical protein
LTFKTCQHIRHVGGIEADGARQDDPFSGFVPFAEFVASVISSWATCITIETGMAFATRLAEERRS